jgi:hypothetical protein
MESHKDLNVVTQRTFNPPFFISSLNHKEHLFSKRQSGPNLRLSPQNSTPKPSLTIDLKKVDRSHAQSEAPSKDIPRNYSKLSSPDKISDLKSRPSVPSESLSKNILQLRPSQMSSTFQSESSPWKRLVTSKQEDIWSLLRKPNLKKSIIEKMKISVKVLKNEVNAFKEIRKEIEKLKDMNLKLMKVLQINSISYSQNEIAVNERLVVQYKVRIKQLEDTIKNSLSEKAVMRDRAIDDNYKILLLTEKIKGFQEEAKKIKDECQEKVADEIKELQAKVGSLKQNLYEKGLEIEKVSFENKALTGKLQVEKTNLSNIKQELEYCSNENMKLMQNSINLIEEILELKKTNQKLQNELLQNQENPKNLEFKEKVEKIFEENKELKENLEKAQISLKEKEQNLNSFQRKWQKNREKRNDLLEKWENLELDLNRLLQEKTLWEQKEKMWKENEILWEKNEELWKIEKFEWENKQKDWERQNLSISKLKENIMLRENDWKKEQERKEKSEESWKNKEKEWKTLENSFNSEISKLLTIIEKLNFEINSFKTMSKESESLKKIWKAKEKEWNDCQELWTKTEREWEQEKQTLESYLKKSKAKTKNLKNLVSQLEKEKNDWNQLRSILEKKIIDQKTREKAEISAQTTINDKDSEIQNLKSMIDTLEKSNKKQAQDFKTKKFKYKAIKSQFQVKEKEWKNEKLEHMYKESELISELNHLHSSKTGKDLNASELKTILENKAQDILSLFQTFAEKVEEKFAALTLKVENQLSSLIEIIVSKKNSFKNNPKSLEDSIIYLSSLPPNSNPLNSGHALQESSVLPFHLLENHDFLLCNLQKLQISYPKLSKLVNLFQKLIENRSKPPKDSKIPNKFFYFSAVPTSYLEKILLILNELEKPISTFAKLSNSPEISPISPDSAIKIEISYRLSESDDVELSRQLEISKSDEHYTKELELVIYNLNEKHQKEIKKVYLEIEERENLFNEEIFKLSVELADLNKENLRFASENKSLKNRVKVLEQVLKEKNEEIDYLKGNERRYERSLEGLQNKVKGYERKSEKVSRASGSDMEYLVEDTEKLKILQERYDKCQEDFQSEKDIMLKEKENLEEIIQTLETELKEFQFPNKV